MVEKNHFEVDGKTTAQASVIGGMLIESGLIGPTLAALRPEDFLNEDLRRLFLAIRKDFSAGQTVDIVTLLDTLAGEGGKDKWAGIMTACMEATPSTANQSLYLDVVRKEAKLQRINVLGMSLARELTLEGAAETVGKLNEQLVARQGVQVLTMEQGLLDFYERLKTPREFLSWGFPELDSKLYAERGDFMLLRPEVPDVDKNLPTKQVKVRRLSEKVGQDVVFTLQALPYGRIEDVKQATDSSMVILLSGLIDPDPKNEALNKRFNAATPKEMLQHLLLPGEIDELSIEVERLSGFRTKTIEDIKNESGAETTKS